MMYRKPYVIKKGEQYQLIEWDTDERIHDEEWLTEKEAKQWIAYLKIDDFLKDIIELAMDFPKRFKVNGKRYKPTEVSFPDWVLHATDEEVIKKFTEIRKELQLPIKMTSVLWTKE